MAHSPGDRLGAAESMVLTTSSQTACGVRHPATLVHRKAIRLVKQAYRIGNINVRSLFDTDRPVKAQRDAKLYSLTMQLNERNIGICGLQETRLKGTGTLMVDGDPSTTGSGSTASRWQLLYSGRQDQRQHGVCLLLNPEWQQALKGDWKGINERLLYARFQLQSGLCLSAVVAYSPTEKSPNNLKQEFYLQLYSVLQGIPARDIVFVLGDFNAQVGPVQDSYRHIMGPYSLQPPEANDNGCSLLDLAAAHKLVLANTIFPHRHAHLYTHTGTEGQQRVIDYILCSKKFRSSIKDCRVYGGFNGDSDHRLLVCTVQLRLSTDVQQQQGPRRSLTTADMQFAVDKLQQADIRLQFGISISNRFAALAVGAAADAAADTSAPCNAEAEWQTFVKATQAVAAETLGPKQRQQQHKSEVTASTFSRIKEKNAAYRTWQQRLQQKVTLQRQLADAQHNMAEQWEGSRQQRAFLQKLQAATAAADLSRRKYRDLVHTVNRCVRRDQHRHLARLADDATACWQAGKLADFHKLVSKIFKPQQPAAGAQGINSKDGRVTYRSVQEQLRRFSEYFAEVFSSEDINAEQQQHMEQLIADMQKTLCGSCAQPDGSNISSSEGGSSSSEGGSSSSSNSSANSSSSCSSGGTAATAACPPSVKEVEAAVAALRNGAAAGADNIIAPLLKASPVMVSWLHRVLVAVWSSGRAPVDWKRALIVPLFKGKGSARDAANYRPISLLSIPGKVYALILLHRVSNQVEGQLLECQCAFRKGRGLNDAVFTLRSLMHKCHRYKEPLYLAFVDLRKAYDSIPRGALWRVLTAYGVDPQVVDLLADLHTGTQAAVKLAGSTGDWFGIDRGVRQGCVIAPLLFNTFFDCVVRLAVSRMPDGCGVQLAYHADGEVLPRFKSAGQSTMLTIATLLYADDLVFMSCDRSELEVMLQTFDIVCGEMGMCVNAAKTELMAIGHDGELPDSVQLSGGNARYVSAFKYLGGVVDTTATWDKEIHLRITKARGRFAEMQRLWCMRKLKVSLKMKCYSAYVLPILMFGSESWALTKKQAKQLEVVHSDCLRQILGVRRCDHHKLTDIRARCGTVSLAEMLKAGRLRWLGHVLRMGEERLPKQALLSQLYGVGSARRGRPRASWEHCVTKDLESLGLPTTMLDLTGACAIRGAWRSMLYKITHPGSEVLPFRRSHAALQRHTSHLRWRAEWLARCGMHTGPRALSD